MLLIYKHKENGIQGLFVVNKYIIPLNFYLFNLFSFLVC